MIWDPKIGNRVMVYNSKQVGEVVFVSKIPQPQFNRTEYRTVLDVRFKDKSVREFNKNMLVPLCKHCEMRERDHADHGKCLYHPTSWEL